MHNDVVLGESIPLIIDPGFKEPPQIYDVNFAVEFSFIANERSSVDPIASTPILSKEAQTLPRRNVVDICISINNS